MSEDEFTAYVGSALGAMKGLAVTISIIGHTVHLRTSSITLSRIVGASARDAVSIIDSLARNSYRHGGIDGISSRIVGSVKRNSGCWLDKTFRPVCDEIVAVRGQKPRDVLTTIEITRREATAHLPIFGQVRTSPLALSAEDMWKAYDWIKAMLEIWISRTSPPSVWAFDERGISDQVRAELAAGLLPVQDGDAVALLK